MHSAKSSRPPPPPPPLGPANWISVGLVSQAALLQKPVAVPDRRLEFGLVCEAPAFGTAHRPLALVHAHVRAIGTPDWGRRRRLLLPSVASGALNKEQIAPPPELSF